MFEKKEPERVNWKKRQEVLKEMAALNEEKKKLLDPLEKRFKEVQERETELQRLAEKISGVNTDFNRRISALEKDLRGSYPKEIDLLVEKLTSQLGDLFTSKHLKSTSSYNFHLGSTVIESNEEGLGDARAIIRASLNKLESLKIQVASEEDLVTTLDRIERETDEAVRKSLATVVKTVCPPIPAMDGR